MVRRTLIHVMQWIGRRERASVLGVLAMSCLLWGFVELADEVFEGETQEVDTWLLGALRSPADPADPLGPPWFEEMARDVTALGGLAVLTMAALSVVGYLLIDGRRRLALYVTAAVGGGILTSQLLKDFFGRDRPEVVPHITIVYTSSFPSGHSMMSAVVYLTLGFLLARVQPRHRLRAYILLVAVLATLLVGLSRVYMGVHWPTDVLAGWSVGAAWATACWLLLNALQRRGPLEEAGPPCP